jgi:ABC-2 type transport system permease protein
MLAAVALVALGLWVGVLTWAGATIAGADVPFGKLVATGLNALPTSLLFLGLGALAYAVAPRHGAGIAYGVVSVAFVWELFGALLGAPAWTLDLSPFHHVGRLPAGSFEAGAAAIMLAIGVAAGALSLVAFRRRDLAGV